MKKLISLICLIFLISISVNAREIYCSVEEKNGNIQINPNWEYLTESYWNYILYDSLGNKREFNHINEATTILANFGWFIVRTETNVNNCTTRIIMGHNVESYNEIKSSREQMYNLFK